MKLINLMIMTESHREQRIYLIQAVARLLNGGMEFVAVLTDSGV